MDLTDIVAGTLVGIDPDPAESVLESLLENNKVIPQVFTILFETVEKVKDAFCVKLCFIMQYSRTAKYRVNAITLLKGLFVPGDWQHPDFCWDSLTLGTKSLIKLSLLEALSFEKKKYVFDHLQALVEEVNGLIIVNETECWPELIEFVVKCLVSGSPSQVVFGLRLLSSGPSVFRNYCVTHHQSLLSHIHQSLTRILAESLHSPAVLIHAIRATLGFMISMEMDTERNEYDRLVASLVRGLVYIAFCCTVTQVEEGTGDNSAEIVGCVLKLLLDSRPSFLNSSLHRIIMVLTYVLKIAKSPNLDMTIRRTAIELMLSNVTRDSPTYALQSEPIRKLFLLLLGMLTQGLPEWSDDEEVVDAHAVENEDGALPVYLFAKQQLAHLIATTTSELIFPSVHLDLKSFSEDDASWEKRHAAMTALTQLSVGFSQDIVKYVPRMMRACVSLVGDPHPRVRLATANAIYQLADALQTSAIFPTVEHHFHQGRSILAERMDIDPSARVQVCMKAAHAKINIPGTSDVSF